MKLSLRLSLLRGAAPAALAFAAAGCNVVTSTTPAIPDAADGGAPSTPGTAPTNDPPHALGVITLGEVHTSGGGSAAPMVSAAFAPDAVAVAAATCSKTLAGCRVPLPALCDGIAAPKCASSEVCTLDKSCNVTCEKPCTKSCGSDEECYFATPSAMACRKVESFDAGALAFAGTTTPITLYPPYSFAGDGSGAPFLAGASIEVQGSGATVAGFDKFDEKFTATTFLQTVPSLAKLPLAQVWGTGAIPVGWVPAGDTILVSVSGPLGTAECDASDAAGHFDVPREVVAAVTGKSTSSLSISVTRQRVEMKKDVKTKGTLSTATVQSIGFLQLTTSSTEAASFVGCSGTQTMCGDHCADLSYSTDDCGQCGHSCGTGYCSGGACYGTSVPCLPSETTCSGVCVDTSTSSDNCGYCGNACTGNTFCFGGICE